MSDKNTKSKRYCFTIHNYTPKELKQFHKLAESLEKHRYISYGLEVAPDTGTKHIQGYVELATAQRLPYVQTYFNIKRDGKVHKFHLEIANGTAEENRKYTSKSGEHFEFGEPQTQGARNDLKLIKEAVKQNPRDIQIIVDEHVSNNQQLKFAEGLRQYYFSNRDPKIPPKVFWIYGETGIGKTSLVYRNFQDICPVSSFEWMGTSYNQNECLLLDDLREFSLPFEQLLKLTDRYPFTLFYKGGQIPLNSPYIVITSPKSIEQTYTSSKENLQQLKRRLTVINLNLISDIENIDLKNLDEKYISKDVNDARDNF
jgi:hypothetical protein